MKWYLWLGRGRRPHCGNVSLVRFCSVLSLQCCLTTTAFQSHLNSPCSVLGFSQSLGLGDVLVVCLSQGFISM